MKEIILALLATLSPHKEKPAPYTQVAIMCFYKGEQLSGMNKICYYDCLGSLTAINVKSYKLCPLSINN